MNQWVPIAILMTVQDLSNYDHEEIHMLTLVAEKQSRIRSALRLLIEQAVGFTIVAEATDTESLTTIMQKTLPDLVLLDWELSQGKNDELISSLKKSHPQMKVVVLSVRPEWRKAAMNSGADAFISKGGPPDRLLMILKSL